MTETKIKYYDVLKAIAIIIIILCHFGVCPNGFLGVYMFLVIAGFFTAKSIDKHLSTNYGYLKFIKSRLFRLWPLVIIAGIVSLVLGWFMMLPDDYENLAQSVVASNLYGNNILLSITTRDYWNVCNEYKPLMHLWFVGVLMQYYILITIICLLITIITSNIQLRKNIFRCCILAFGCISFLVFKDIIDLGDRYFYLPSRFLELAGGSIAYFILSSKKVKISDSIPVRTLFYVLNAFLLITIVTNIDTTFLPDKRITNITITSLLLLLSSKTEISRNRLFSNKLLAIIGASSFSIYVWHQVVIAFVRYSFTKNLIDPTTLLVVIALIIILSSLSYKHIEKITATKRTWSIICTGLILSTAFALHIYWNAGVVHDVPELDIYKGEGRRGMWAEYCDRGYQYNKDYTQSSKPKWYVIGNSFGRDFVNIIEESDIANDVEVSYSDFYNLDKQRIAKADIVFISTHWFYKELADEIKPLCNPHTEIYIVGEKNFGECNGQVYRRRFSSDYKQTTMPIQDIYIEKNEAHKALFKDHYIDLLSYVLQPNGFVRVFSDDGKYISQDCLHLTKAGAQFYAKRINWNIFF
jgi:peptidoglycan/LPS O-acetylase OafA/YrhL